MKKYVIIAGVNGTGKSTLYQSMDFLQSMERVNTDEIVKQFGKWNNPSDIIKAGKIALNKIQNNFSKGISFNQETTLCGKRIIKNINKAKELGYIIELHYVGVDSTEILKKRIAYRVEHGGHGIPDSDVERRYIDSFKQLIQVMDICDVVFFYDNNKVFRQFAIYKNNSFYYLSNDFPDWFKLKVLNEKELFGNE